MTIILNLIVYKLTNLNWQLRTKVGKKNTQNQQNPKESNQTDCKFTEHQQNVLLNVINGTASNSKLLHSSLLVELV